MLFKFSLLMNNDLSNYRKNYEKKELLEANCPTEPFKLFTEWFKNADNSESVEEANAMTVSTIGTDGFPKNRVVLLKQFSSDGFIFYTNYNSEKGKAILNNPNVCISFFWPSLEQQIIIKGKATKVSSKVSDTYFNSRPNGSKLGAWASNQSQVIASKDHLHTQLEEAIKKFSSKEITRPEHWGGFIIKPFTFEFWQGRPNRLHDRILYSLKKDFSWKQERLAP